MDKEKLIAAMREVANYNYSCTCIEAYKGRDMVDPDCHYCNVFDDTFLSDLAEAALKELGNEWVRVEDRLPEPISVVVIMANINIGPRLGYYINKDWYYMTVGTSFWVSKEPHVKITHWQPLPSPPKDK